MTKPGFFEKWIYTNGSYKIVALFVALVLWVAILGRKDFILTHELKLAFTLPVNTEVKNDVSNLVKVKIGGPRLAVKRFKEANPEITIDLRRAGLGRTNLRIQESDFVLPPKVRLIAISPSFLSVEIHEKLK